MTIEEYKERLGQIILARSFKYSDNPPFTLASGRQSNYYFNCKPTTLDPEGMNLIGIIVFVINPAGKLLILHQKGEGNIVLKAIFTHKAELHSVIALFHQVEIHFLDGSLPNREEKVNKKGNWDPFQALT